MSNSYQKNKNRPNTQEIETDLKEHMIKEGWKYTGRDKQERLVFDNGEHEIKAAGLETITYETIMKTAGSLRNKDRAYIRTNDGETIVLTKKGDKVFLQSDSQDLLEDIKQDKAEAEGTPITPRALLHPEDFEATCRFAEALGFKFGKTTEGVLELLAPTDPEEIYRCQQILAEARDTLLEERQAGKSDLKTRLLETLPPATQKPILDALEWQQQHT